MKYILGILMAVAIVGLSYISLHAYEEVLLTCDVPEDFKYQATEAHLDAKAVRAPRILREEAFRCLRGPRAGSSLLESLRVGLCLVGTVAGFDAILQWC